MGRTPCCKQEGLKKGAWTADEDQKLVSYIQQHGENGWRTLPGKAGLKRCGKSCRLRWANYLKPDIKRGKFSVEEENAIIQLHAMKGNKWSAIARRLPGRTDNEIKNFWNTHLKKRLVTKNNKPINTNKKHYKTKTASLSVKLLNCVASKITKTINHATLSKMIRRFEDISNPNNEDIDSSTFLSSSTMNYSEISWDSYSTSKLLNKMANSPTMFQEVFSKAKSVSKDNKSCGSLDSFNDIFEMISNDSVLDNYKNVEHLPMFEMNFFQENMSPSLCSDEQSFTMVDFWNKSESDLNDQLKMDECLLDGIMKEDVPSYNYSACSNNENVIINTEVNEGGLSTSEDNISLWNDNLDVENYDLQLDLPIF